MFIPLTVLLTLLPALLAHPVKRATGQIISSGRDNLCLSIEGGSAAVSTLSNGVKVVSLPCPQASTWDISPGSGSVVVSGNSGFALDAGSNPGDNGELKVWTSYPGLYQQTWYLTGDNRIAITGGDQCLDEGDNGVQTYECTTGNTNQVWYASTSGFTPLPPTPPPTTQPTNGHTVGQIYWNADPTSCLSLVGGRDASGQYAALTECFPSDSPYLKYQTWTVNSSNGQITTPNGFCLDAGVNPQNYNEVKVWTCYPGLEQQNWSVLGNGNLIAVPNGQCLDVIKESNAFSGDPYGTTKQVEMYACSVPDPQQQFTYVQ